MRPLYETDIDNGNHFVGEFLCDCGEKFLAEVTDKAALDAEVGPAPLVNMVLSDHNFPLAKCPNCGTVETFA